MRWLKLDQFWGDASRWIFEAYRAASGELPYRDFAWQYPPISIYFVAGFMWLLGAKYFAVQVAVDLLSCAIVLLTWDLARRYVPAVVATAVAAALACAGAANTSNFALFSLRMYSPAILTGTVGMLLVLRGAVDLIEKASISRLQVFWLALGSTIGLLSKPEFILAVVGILVWLPARDRLKLAALCVLPSVLVYWLASAAAGAANVAAGVGGYGIAALTCPWWPTGIGLFGAVASLGYGAVLTAMFTLLDLGSPSFAGKYWRIWLLAAAGVLATIAYLPYCFEGIPVLRNGHAQGQIAGYFLSTGTILLPVMWFGILRLTRMVVGRGYRWDDPDVRRMLALLTPAVLISLRGLFGTTMSQLTAVSVAAYSLWFIFVGCLLVEILRYVRRASNAPAIAAATLCGYAVLRIAGMVVADLRQPYETLSTRAGTVRVADVNISPGVLNFVRQHSQKGEDILDVASGGGVNFSEYRKSPIFSTQFAALAPSEDYLQEDLRRIASRPPRLVIANTGENFQATYGICSNTGCPIPKFVWRSQRPACDVDKTFPVLNYIQANYSPVASFGDKVIYARR